MTYLKPIKVGYTSYESFIDDDTMQQVEALLQGNTYCQSCQKKFTNTRLEVFKNVCLGCFIVKHTNLKYTGSVWPDNQGVPQYLFMDARGHITLASPDSANTQEPIWATLEYWGFTLPEWVESGSVRVALSKWRWHSLYSHPKQWAVIATHQPSYDAKLLYFLLQKDGSSLLLDRRLKRVRDMLAQARADIVAGKGGKELEDFGGSRYDPSDYMIYRRLADMISEQHDNRQQAAS